MKCHTNLHCLHFEDICVIEMTSQTEFIYLWRIQKWKLMLKGIFALNPLSPGQIFWCIYWNEIFCLFIQMLLKLIPMGRKACISALDQLMVWHRIGSNLHLPMLQFNNWYIDNFLNFYMKDNIHIPIYDDRFIFCVNDVIGCQGRYASHGSLLKSCQIGRQDYFRYWGML